MLAYQAVIKHLTTSLNLGTTYLSTNLFLFRVIHDGRWADGEESDILVLLAIAHVDLTPLALPEVAQGAWPDSGLHDDNVVLFGAVQRVAHRVGLLVTVGSEDPGRVSTLACLVHRDWLQTGLVWVGSEDSVDRGFSIFDLLTEAVARFIVSEDALSVVNPSVFVAHLRGGGSWDLCFGILRGVGLDIEGELTLLSWVTLGDLVSANRHKLGCVVDSGDLSTEVVLLLAEVEWVGDDFSIEVTREANLDFSGALEILRLQIRQDFPRTLCPV